MCVGGGLVRPHWWSEVCSQLTGAHTERRKRLAKWRGQSSCQDQGASNWADTHGFSIEPRSVPSTHRHTHTHGAPRLRGRSRRDPGLQFSRAPKQTDWLLWGLCRLAAVQWRDCARTAPWGRIIWRSYNDMHTQTKAAGPTRTLEQQQIANTLGRSGSFLSGLRTKFTVYVVTWGAQTGKCII